jgi:hypothetical protein
VLKNANDSPYRDFFIDWNEFWKDHGTMGEEGHIVPDKEHLDKFLFVTLVRTMASKNIEIIEQNKCKLK